MHSERSVDGGAIDAEKDAVSARRPRGILSAAVEANLVGRQSAKTTEDRRNVCFARPRVRHVGSEREN